MDARVSRKEQRWQPDGSPAMVLVNNVFDFYPVFGNPLDTKYITDIEMITDAKAEVLDRGMFAVIKQRGEDPVELDDGIQWAEYVLGEIPGAMIVKQVQDAVALEGPAVTVTPYSTAKGTSFKVELTA